LKLMLAFINQNALSQRVFVTRYTGVEILLTIADQYNILVKEKIFELLFCSLVVKEKDMKNMKKEIDINRIETYNVPYANTLKSMNLETLSSVLTATVKSIKNAQIYNRMIHTFKFTQICLQYGVVNESSDILKLLLECFENLYPYLNYTPPTVLNQLIKTIHCFIVAFPISVKHLTPLFSIFIKNN